MSKALLWVDDDGSDRFLYEERVLRRRGWEVHWATDLASALAALSSQRFDAVILDQSIPNSKEIGDSESVWAGATILAWLRGVPTDRLGKLPQEFEPLGANRTAAICILSAFYDDEAAELIRESEFPGEIILILSKPVDLDELMRFLDSR
jgi:hypothetical protein